MSILEEVIRTQVLPVHVNTPQDDESTDSESPSKIVDVKITEMWISSFCYDVYHVPMAKATVTFENGKTKNIVVEFNDKFNKVVRVQML